MNGLVSAGISGFSRVDALEFRVVGYQVSKPAGSPKKTMMVFLTDENYG